MFNARIGGRNRERETKRSVNIRIVVERLSSNLEYRNPESIFEAFYSKFLFFETLSSIIKTNVVRTCLQPYTIEEKGLVATD